MLKEYFLDITQQAVTTAVEENKLGQMNKEDEYSLSVEIPKNTQFGDFAINVSSLSRYAKMAPSQIAAVITDCIKTNDFEVNVVAGFINFKLGKSFLNSVIKQITENKSEFAKCNIGKGEKVILEYVSANPTGPFHIGHGRWAAMGSALANVMNYAGYDVFQEFYINDAGNQINNLGRSLYIRVLQEMGVDADFPEDEALAKSFYCGEYLLPVAKSFVEDNAELALKSKNIPLEEVDEETLKTYSQYARLKMLDMQKKLLENFRTDFDLYYSELDLHLSGEVEECIAKLQDSGMLYEQDGALWFKSSQFGDDQDRVIKKTDGSYTYLTADIAYHYDKLRRGFDRIINIWGADHHGYVARMRAAIEALGYNPDSLEVLLGQLVNLVIKGEQVRMGKRSKMITLEDLINDVGVDATRYWMIMRSIDTTLDFDIELAKSNTDENPVFYVQYAHARACSIMRNASSERPDTVNNSVLAPMINKEELEKAIASISDAELNAVWSESEEKSVEVTKKLILKLEEYKAIVVSAAQNRTPYLITKYLQELAACFHQFYTFSKVLVEDKALMIARLAIVNSVSIVLKSALSLIAVSAPEKM